MMLLLGLVCDRPDQTSTPVLAAVKVVGPSRHDGAGRKYNGAAP
jgi:hypothetical protein